MNPLKFLKHDEKVYDDIAMMAITVCMMAGIPISPKGNIEIYIMGRKNPDQKPKDLVYPILDEVLSMLKFK